LTQLLPGEKKSVDDMSKFNAADQHFQEFGELDGRAHSLGIMGNTPGMNSEALANVGRFDDRRGYSGIQFAPPAAETEPRARKIRKVGVKSLLATDLLPDGDEHRGVRAAHRVYEHLISLWAPGAIEAAFDLGIFVQLAEGPSTSTHLARALGTDARATEVLLEGLVAYDILERIVTGDGIVIYVLPHDNRDALLPEGTFSLAGKIRYDRERAWHAWRNLADAVRSGADCSRGEEQLNQISTAEYLSLVNGINFWAPPVVSILRTALARRGWTADQPKSMVDVGCGSGIYSHLMLKEFPALDATGIDVERITSLANAQAARLGVGSRFNAVVGDWNQDCWGQFDLVLLVNIFHLQSAESAERLMQRISNSLAPGGLVAIVDHVIDDSTGSSSTHNRFFRLFAASMIATGGGGSYTLSEYDGWLEQAGLRRVGLLDTPMHRILLAERPRVSELAPSSRDRLANVQGAPRLPEIGDSIHGQGSGEPALFGGVGALARAAVRARASVVVSELQLLGIAKGSRIALCANGALAAVTAWIAMLETEAVCVPLGADWGESRLLQALSDGSLRVALVDAAGRRALEHLSNITLVELDTGELASSADRISRLD
jgi:SAM-dependent methyltransferase